LDQRDQIHKAFDACADRKERVSKQLYSAKGSIDSMIHDIKRCIQVFAARPVDPESFVVQVNDPTIREIYGRGSMKKIMNLSMFNSVQYLSFQQRVRAAEDTSIGLFGNEQTHFLSNETEVIPYCTPKETACH
jgi:hypothetical protein